MTWWDRFLASLATRGGTIFALVSINVLIVLLMLLLVHIGREGSAFATAILQVFGNFTGALLLALKSGDSPTPEKGSGPSGTAAG